jgi:Na+-translocating ferredoxin:NAD+ oxidoreductase RnfG subunit
VPSTAALSLLGPISPLIAHCEVYLSAEQVLAVLFPDSKFQKLSLELSEKDVHQLEEKLSLELKNRALSIWRDKDKNAVYIDQVIGKHELITYAVGMDSHGKIKGVEILEYREAYGGQIRNSSWRKQFVGKDHSSRISLNRDIQNISGATLSSMHVTEGVKKMVTIHELIKDRS